MILRETAGMGSLMAGGSFGFPVPGWLKDTAVSAGKGAASAAAGAIGRKIKGKGAPPPKPEPEKKLSTGAKAAIGGGILLAAAAIVKAMSGRKRA